MTEPPEEEGAQTFAELGLTKEVLTALDEMGWETPTPVQRDSYPLAVAGHDVTKLPSTPPELVQNCPYPSSGRAGYYVDQRSGHFTDE